MTCTKRLIVTTTLAALIALPCLAAVQSRAEVDLRAAIETETVKGDLKAAIALYSKLSQNNDRSVAARALLRLAGCHEKLGSAEARKAYEQLVQDFADQKEAVEARARLAALTTAASEVRARLLWDNAADLGGTTTADGRYLSFTDWDTGDLAIRDLPTGQSRRVTNKGGYDAAKGEAEDSSISPDGKRIAFRWVRWDKEAVWGSCELRSIDTDGKNERVLLKGKDIHWVVPGSWSPDTKWIATMLRTETGETRISLVSPDGEPPRTLLTLPKPASGFALFSPDGRWVAFESQPRSGSLDSGSLSKSVHLLPTEGSAVTPTEVISDGALMGWAPDGTAILFSKEFNGVRSLYLQRVANGKAAGDPQVIPSAKGIGAVRLGVTRRGSLVHGSYNRTDEAVALSLGPDGQSVGAPKATMPIVAYGFGNLSGGIRYSPDGRRVLYTTSTRTVLIRSLADGSERTLMPQMDRIGRIEWAADSNSLLISGATGNGPAGVYRVDLQSGAATLLFAGQGIWLMAASPDGSTLYYRTVPKKPVVARDLRTGFERVLVDAHAATFDLKTSKDGKSLAVIGFRDLRIVDVASGKATVLYAPEDPDASTNPAFSGGDWSADGRRFYTFARLDNHHRTELWSFPVGGGPPVRQRVTGNFRGVWISPDGRQLATIRQEETSQVWSLDNFLPVPAPRGQ